MAVFRSSIGLDGLRDPCDEPWLLRSNERSEGRTPPLVHRFSAASRYAAIPSSSSSKRVPADTAGLTDPVVPLGLSKIGPTRLAANASPILATESSALRRSCAREGPRPPPCRTDRTTLASDVVDGAAPAPVTSDNMSRLAWTPRVVAMVALKAAMA